MAHYSNQLVRDAREAIFEGLTFDEFFYNRVTENVKRKYAQKAWNRANMLCDNEELWNRFLLDDIRSRFGGFVDAIVDYYQEGFGYDDLANAFSISRDAVAELIRSHEG